MSDDTLHFNPPLSDMQLAVRIERFYRFTENVKCTCKGCANERTCLYSWDTYNTGDDCLADK